MKKAEKNENKNIVRDSSIGNVDEKKVTIELEKVHK